MVKYNAKTKKMAFAVDLPDAKFVSVLGDFNGWNEETHPMKKDKSGTWKTEIAVGEGEYQFRYRVDHSRWLNDETTPTVWNQFGTENSVAIVRTSNGAKAVRKPRPSVKRSRKKSG